MTKEERRADNKARYEWYKAHGYCVHCHREKAAPGHVQCLNCLDERHLYDDTRRELRRDRWNANLQENNAKQHERYHRLKEQGMCVACGKAQATCGVLCLNCYVRRKAKKRAKSEAKGNTLQYRREHDLCLECGQPLDTDKKLCAKCCDRRRVFKLEWWQQLRENDPERYKALVRSMQPVSGMSFYGKYAREGVTV